MRTRGWIAGAVVAVAALAAALIASNHERTAPRSVLGDVVGVRRSRPAGPPFCSWFVRDTRYGTLPTGTLHCAWGRPGTARRRVELDRLAYHVLTRRVRSAERTWASIDSATWTSDIDSMRVELARQGGSRVCAQRTMVTPTGVREYWRFPGFQVILRAGVFSWEGSASLPRYRHWHVNIQGERDSKWWCHDPSAPA